MIESRNLLVMPFGNNSIESEWIFEKKERHFDVVLLYYHKVIKKEIIKAGSEHFAVFHLEDFKWPMIQSFFNLHSSYLQKYDYFFFPDDDIELSRSSIQQLFKCAQHFNLQMTQPVLSLDSYKSWRVLRKKFFSGVRYLSAVELMCPLMTRDALIELLPTFNLNHSGWGIDILWGDIIRKKFGEKSIAVFDLIETKHTKPVGTGEMYSKLGKSAFEERDEIFQQYGLELTKIVTLPVSENTFKNKLRSYFMLKKQLK
ncbi:MAG: DUF707 domain-containing protein [Cytophagales bacterium]